MSICSHARMFEGIRFEIQHALFTASDRRFAWYMVQLKQFYFVWIFILEVNF